MFFILTIGILVLFVTKDSFAWGACVHFELAQSLLSQASELVGAMGIILLANKRDFLLGNILADVIIGKKLSRRRHQSHHWQAGLRILNNAYTDSEQAFALGFLAHLAADTVAHNEFIPRQIVLANSTKSLGHLYWELRADQCVDLTVKNQLFDILTNDKTHDKLLSDNIYPYLKSFRINRTIFARINRFALKPKFIKAMNLCETFSPWALSSDIIEPYKQQSMERMTDIIIKGSKSYVLNEDPNGLRIFEILKSRSK